MTLYEILKYVHIVMAIAAIGFNLSYAFWLARAEKEPEHAAHLLKGIKILDDRFANPAYAVLLITGIIMVLKEDLGFDTFWIAAGLALYVVVTLLAIIVYSPTLRNQVLLAEAGKLDDARIQEARHKRKNPGRPTGPDGARHRVPNGDQTNSLIGRGSLERQGFPAADEYGLGGGLHLCSRTGSK